jgi:conjugal transfer pilus assembly protein TraV
MTHAIRPALALVLAIAASGCATFATNVEGDFSCRAPKGACAPTHVIDAAASATLESDHATVERARVHAGVENGDTDRTAERTLKIVFPAHVDAWGTLHDEAIAWTVVENPRWAAELRRKPGEETAPPLMRQLKEQLRAAEAAADIHADLAAGADVPAPDENASPDRATFDLSSPFSLSPTASPLVLPSTAREAVAGAKAPAVEGFDMPPPPHDRTPRPEGESPALVYPSAEAIDAAKADAPSETTSPAANGEAE